MGQQQSHAAPASASRSPTSMGKRITAPNPTTHTQPTSATTTTATTTFPALTPSTVRTQLKHLNATLTPQLISAIKRRDESAITQFESLHTQLTALYNHPSLPSEYEVSVHELWSRVEVLRAAVSGVEGLRERGRVGTVTEMVGEEETEKRRKEARRRMEEVEKEEVVQRKKAIELQKLAAKRAAEQRAARSKQTKLTGRVTKARKNGQTTKQQHRKRKVMEEEQEEEEDVEEEEEEADVELEDEDEEEEEEEIQQPSTKKAKPSAPHSTRLTRASNEQQKNDLSSTKPVKPSKSKQPLPSRTSTPSATTTTSMPKTYTRITATATSAATQSVQPTEPAQLTRKSPRKQPQSTPATTAAATPQKRNKSKSSHVDDSQAEQEQRASTATAVLSRMNLTRLTAGMTPERKKVQQRQQQAEVKQAAGPGVGRTGRRKRTATVTRADEQDVYDVFDA